MKKIVLTFFALILSIFFSGCNPEEHIFAQTTFLNRTELASYYVETPDPQLNYPLIGQRLFVSWTLPAYYLNYRDLHLAIKIRYGNRSEACVNVVVDKGNGYYLYELQAQDFEDKGGIVTYKIDLIGDDMIIEKWRHHLWVELITVGEQKCDAKEA